MSERTELTLSELEHTARSARERLLTSLSHLEQRTKQLASTAKHATAAGAWTVAALGAFMISVSLARQPAAARRAQPASGLAWMVRAAAAAVGLAATGVLVYSAQRRARALAALGHDRASLPRLEPGGLRAQPSPVARHN